MLRSKISQFYKFVGHILSNHVSSVTQVLESLDPDDTGPSDTIYKNIDPEILGSVEHSERHCHNGWTEDEDKVKKPKDAHEKLADRSEKFVELRIFSICSFPIERIDYFFLMAFGEHCETRV